MLIAAQIVGFAAVGLYLLSYQLKKRTQIVWVTFASNLFYVLQYFMLGAFSGAIMDMLSTVASYLAVKKNAPRWKQCALWIELATIFVTIVIGIVIATLRCSWLELLPIAGTVFQVISQWCNREQTLRKFGLCSAPFWLVYNFASKAYGAALGSALVMISIVVSLARYRESKHDTK